MRSVPGLANGLRQYVPAPPPRAMGPTGPRIKPVAPTSNPPIKLIPLTPLFVQGVKPGTPALKTGEVPANGFRGHEQITNGERNMQV